MKIGELARETGVSVRLLRYYEEQGLLAPDRTESGQRRYPPNAPEVVRHIRTLLDAGLPTKVIRQVLPCVEGPQTVVASCVADLLRDQLVDLDDRIAALERARRSLAGILATTTAA